MFKKSSKLFRNSTGFNIIILLFPFFVIYSCKEKIRPEKGGLDLISNVYVDASKGLDKVQNFHISRMNYSGSNILELIPDLNFPEMTENIFYIKDSVYFKIGTENSGNTILSEISKKQKLRLLQSKMEGAIFSKDWIPNYKNKKNLSDTILFNKTYKRFEVNSPWTYSRFYIYPTDTILPYSLYKHAEEDYGGRLERIDSYNKKKDVFVTLQLITRKNWDNEAKEIFDFNAFVKKKK